MLGSEFFPKKNQQIIHLTSISPITQPYRQLVDLANLILGTALDRIALGCDLLQLPVRGLQQNVRLANALDAHPLEFIVLQARLKKFYEKLNLANSRFCSHSVSWYGVQHARAETKVKFPTGGVVERSRQCGFGIQNI